MEPSDYDNTLDKLMDFAIMGLLVAAIIVTAAFCLLTCGVI